MNYKALLILLFTAKFCFSQHVFDMENEMHKGYSELHIKYYNKCCFKRGVSAKIFFNSNGKARKIDWYTNRKKTSTYLYQYDSLGHLTKEILASNSFNQDTGVVAQYEYTYNEQKLIEKKIAHVSRGGSWVSKFSAFNSFEKPQKSVEYDATTPNKQRVRHLTYNTQGLLITVEDDTSRLYCAISHYKYNPQGDKIYQLHSLIENGKEIKALVSGGDAEAIYMYKYKKSGKWIKKYAIISGRKYIREKRRYIVSR